MLVKVNYIDDFNQNQVYTTTLPLSVLNPLADWVQEGTEPELTFWFDLPPAIAAARRAAQQAARSQWTQDAKAPGARTSAVNDGGFFAGVSVHKRPALIALAVFVSIGILKWPMLPVILVCAPISIACAWPRKNANA